MKLSKLVFVLILLLPSVSFAWDCSYWHQSSDPSAECYSASQPVKQGQHQSQQAIAVASPSSSADASNNNNGNTTVIDTEYHAAKIPVNTAYAASLTSGVDTCLGSASGGAQTSMLGVSLAKTRDDQNCKMIKQVQLLREMGLDSAACYRARQGPEGADIDKAMRLAGVDCDRLQKPVMQPVVINNDVVTHEELREVESRIVKKTSQK